MKHSKAKKIKKELLRDLAELPEKKDEFARISEERLEEIKKDPQSIQKEEINTLSLFSSLLRLEDTNIIEEKLKEDEMDEEYIRKRFTKDLPSETEELIKGKGKKFMEKSGKRALDVVGYLMHTNDREEAKKEVDRIEGIIKGSKEVEDSLIRTDIFMQSLGAEEESKKGLREKAEEYEA